MNSKILLIIACVLILIGVTKPEFGGWLPVNSPTVVVTPPSDSAIMELCTPVIMALKEGGSSRSQDGKRLSNLFMDISTLIELDNNDQVVKTTDDIRYVNALSGPMLRMDIKGKYPNLASSAQKVVVSIIGDDSIPLDSELRQKTVEAFRALAWACNEGSK